MTTTPRIDTPARNGWVRAILGHKRLVTGSIAFFVAIGLAINAFTPPVYRATVRVEFPRGGEQHSPWIGEPPREGNFQSENMALFTSAELIRNRVLLGRLASDMSRIEPQLLAQASAQRKSKGLFGWQPPGVRPANATATNAPAGVGLEADPVAYAAKVDHLERSITVQPVADTRLVDIRVEDNDPVIARETADRLAGLFVDWQQQRMAAADTSGLTYILGEIDQVKSRIEKTSATLARLGVPRARTSYVRSPRGGGDVSSLGKDLTRLQSQLSALRSGYKDGHPKVQALQAEIASVRNQILATPLGSYETQAVRTLVPAPRQAVLENDLAVDEALYARLVARAREVGIERQMMTPAVFVVQPATVEPEPVRPRPLLNLAVCLLAGAIVGLGLALVRGGSTRLIHDATDAEAATGLPVLAVMPKSA